MLSVNYSEPESWVCGGHVLPHGKQQRQNLQEQGNSCKGERRRGQNLMLGQRPKDAGQRQGQEH